MVSKSDKNVEIITKINNKIELFNQQTTAIQLNGISRCDMLNHTGYTNL